MGKRDNTKQTELISNKKTTILFKIIKMLIRLFYGKVEIIGMENLPDKNAIIVGNHTQMNGPICGELFMPENVISGVPAR